MFSFYSVPEATAAGSVGVAFSDRRGGTTPGPMGELNLGRTDVADLGPVQADFESVRTRIGVDRIVTLAQVHGADVVSVDEDFLDSWGPHHHLGSDLTGVPLQRADALVTTLPDVALCIRVADCVPVLLADSDAGVLGAAHAGRAGLVAGVVEATVTAMRQRGAGAITAWVGPHICGECYEVPEAMRHEVSGQLPSTFGTTSWGTPALDLGAGVATQLEELGCVVNWANPCTRTSPDLHSHRRDGTDAGRLAGLIWRTAAA